MALISYTNDDFIFTGGSCLKKDIVTTIQQILVDAGYEEVSSSHEKDGYVYKNTTDEGYETCIVVPCYMTNEVSNNCKITSGNYTYFDLQMYKNYKPSSVDGSEGTLDYCSNTAGGVYSGGSKTTFPTLAYDNKGITFSDLGSKSDYTDNTPCRYYYYVDSSELIFCYYFENKVGNMIMLGRPHQYYLPDREKLEMRVFYGSHAGYNVDMCFGQKQGLVSNAFNSLCYLTLGMNPDSSGTVKASSIYIQDAGGTVGQSNGVIAKLDGVYTLVHNDIFNAFPSGLQCGDIVEVGDKKYTVMLFCNSYSRYNSSPLRAIMVRTA